MGRVWPRHEQRGRPLNAIVRLHEGHHDMESERQSSAVVHKELSRWDRVGRVLWASFGAALASNLVIFLFVMFSGHVRVLDVVPHLYWVATAVMVCLWAPFMWRYLK